MSATQANVDVSLTQFIRFAIKSPEQQITVVREIIKQHEGYSVPQDLYKQLRHGVPEYHRGGHPRSFLDQIVSRQTEPARVKHFSECVAGYKGFLGRKKIGWFSPPSGVWSCEGLIIRLRPELGLVVDGQRTVVKLWFNDDESLNKRRADLILHLLRLGIDLDGDTKLALLNVRKARLYVQVQDEVHQDQTVLLRSQARSLLTMYRELRHGAQLLV